MLGAAGLYALRPSRSQLGAEDDATTQAAKRALLSGDRMLLERRARDLARATGVPLAALDRGLALWDARRVELERPRSWPAAMRSALALLTGVRPPAAEARPGAAWRWPRSPTACPAAPTYDPWAWIIWGREITELDLDTRTGPSWKPLPVLFTTPFSLAGDRWAPELWLVVAQAGGLLAFVFAYRLARAARRPGRPA